MNPIVSREEARALGSKRYFTGIPCPKGHLSDRFVSSRGCVECSYEKRRASADYNNAYASEWRARNRDKVAAALSKYRQTHREDRNAAARLAYHVDPDKGRARTKAWRALNPEGVRAHAMTRLVRKRNIGGRYTADDVRSLMMLQKGRCVNCKCDIRKKYHVDHVVPLSKGGENTARNLQLLCVKCNLSKHAQDPIDWAQRNGRLL